MTRLLEQSGLDGAPLTIATERLALRLMHSDATAAGTPPLKRVGDGRIIGQAPSVRPDWVRLDVLLDGEPIGEVGLLFQEDGLATEIGYRIAPEHRRRGFASEALHELVGLAFEVFGEAELAAQAAVDNIASHATLLRLGFVEMGSAGQQWSNRRAAYVDYRRYHLPGPARREGSSV